MSFQSNYSVAGRFRHVFLAACSGLVLSFALQQPGTWLAAWIGLVPLLVAIRDQKPARAAVCGLVTGIVYYGIILHWISLFGYLPWMLLVVYQALYFAIFASLYRRIGPERIGWKGYLAVPALWVVLQYLRTLGAYAFIWGSFAHTQVNNLFFAQLSAVTGPWGLDFIICLFNLSLATAAATHEKRRCVPLAIASVIALSANAYGIVITQPYRYSPKAPLVSFPGWDAAAVLQGNMKNDFSPVPNYNDISFATFSRMTREAARKGASMVVWPETAIPSDITSPGWADRIGALARDNKVEILAGGYDPSTDPKKIGSYNAVFLFGKDGRKIAAYRKVQLVPFGEFVPLRDQLPLLKNYGVRPEDVLPARRHVLLPSSIGKIGVSICFESLFPQIARKETLDGADVLCVVTNDAWFQRTQAAREHLMMAQLRALENHRWLLRAAGTGISAVIDPYGQIREHQGLFTQGILYGGTIRHGCTIYTRFGDWFVYFSAAILIVCLLLPSRSSSESVSASARPRENAPASESQQNPR